MVSTTSDTYDTLFTNLTKAYGEVVPAEALFWKRSLGGNNYDYGLRVEAPTLMKEFTDGVNLGTGMNSPLTRASRNYVGSLVVVTRSRGFLVL